MTHNEKPAGVLAMNQGCDMDNKELIERLRRDLSMSLYANHADLWSEVEHQRRHAADALERAEAELAALGAREERERMCHAGCGVIAGCDTDESLAAATDGIHPDYLSPSLQSVASTMRKLIDTRAELAKYRSAPVQVYMEPAFCDEFSPTPRDGWLPLIIRPESA